MPDKNDNSWATAMRYLSLALMLPASTLAGYWIGSALDHVFATHALKTVFMILGTAGGFTQFIRGMTKP
jgi:F0F1-type ATP synthase assembly protein I